MVYPEYDFCEVRKNHSTPHPFFRLRNKALDSVTVSHLLQADVVRSKLGTSFKLPRTDPENFRAILEQYLSSSNNSNTSVLWPLVRRVEVSGRFPVLSTGIVLVDLPGHGDDDDTRNDFASAYIKEADGVILVTDVKRAQHDRETLAYLRKIITQLIIDGRSVEDCILLAATGADASIGDKEIHLEQDVQLKYDRRVKDLKELRKSLHLLKKSKMNKSKQREQQREVEDGIRDIEKDNALLLANVRIAAVTTSLNDFFGELHASLAPDGSATPRLPIFCLGSQDYLALKSGARTLGVFFDEDATEIPGLKTHLRTIGERSRIRWVTRAVDNAEALSEDIHSYFSEGRYPGRLHSQAKKKVLDLIGKLDESNLEEAGNAFDAIKEEFERIEGEVEKAVERAAENSASIMKEFGSRVHHNTYRACMQRNGLYYAHDINRDLTRNILPAIQGSWNGGINHRIPLTLKDATAKIEENTLAAIADISQTLDFQGTALAQSRAIARQPLAIESILSDMLGEAIKSISVAQRDGTRSFSAVIQKELTPQYQSVLKEVKSGSSARMRCSNEAYMTQNGHVVFQAINTHISQLFRDSLARVKHDIRAELQDITTQLRLSLVEEVNLSPDHKETKDKILQLALENRQTFATRKLDLGYRRRSLEMK
ncbi:hypothetical protein FB451DRAFT_524685 [Mycena latifolia]|nr:hypothetical protein FB451DRAFT_524685 [Mycena latifolia]